MRMTKASMKRICENLTSQMAGYRTELKSFCENHVYTEVSISIHRLNSQLYDYLSMIKDKKITNLTNTQRRETPPEQTVEAVATNNAQDTSKLVVTIPEDLPLSDDERSLLSKGPNFIPVTTLTDEFTVKEDSEKFFRRLRLRAHFTEVAAQTQEGAVSLDNSLHESEGDVTITPTASETSSDDRDISTEVILQDFNSKKSKWTPLPGKFSALDHYIDKCRREINRLNFKEKCNQYFSTRLFQTTRDSAPFSISSTNGKS